MRAVCEYSSTCSEGQSSPLSRSEPEFVDLCESTDDEGHQEEMASDSGLSSTGMNSSSDTIRANKEMRKTHLFSRSRPKKSKEMDFEQPVPHCWPLGNRNCCRPTRKDHQERDEY